MNEKFGYARVSSRDQNLDRQLSALQDVQISSKKIYVDKMSGNGFQRPGYQRLLRQIRQGDELYIKSIDRLGRNYEEIIEQWKYITKTKCVDIIVLDFPLLDTRLSGNGLTGRFIADITLQIMSYVAQIERENTRQRQAEGIREAKRRGVKFGRPQIPIPDEFEVVYTRWKNDEISKRDAARLLQSNHMTFSRWAERIEEMMATANHEK